MGILSKIDKLCGYAAFKIKIPPRNPEAKRALFYIKSINPNRRFLQIARQILYCGYGCDISLNFREYIRLDSLGRAAARLPGVYPADLKKDRPYAVVVSDDREFLSAFDKKTLKIFFNLRIFSNLSNISDTAFFYPITQYRTYLHPDIEQKILAATETGNRRIAAIFAGNVDGEYYNREITKKLFNVHTRFEIFSHIQNSLGGDALYMPSSRGDLLKKIKSGFLRDKIVLINTSKIFIPPDLWFKILLDTNFFIHMCGYLQPYCHNQIESMVAGCIPVTEFSRFFVPPFEHEKNALVFNTLEELTALLAKISGGHYRPSTDTLRKAVTAYYRLHYSFESFKEKLNSLPHRGVDYTDYYIYCEEDEILNELPGTR